MVVPATWLSPTEMVDSSNNPFQRQDSLLLPLRAGQHDGKELKPWQHLTWQWKILAIGHVDQGNFRVFNRYMIYYRWHPSNQTGKHDQLGNLALQKRDTMFPSSNKKPTLRI